MDVLTEQVIDKINNKSHGESFYLLRFRKSHKLCMPSRNNILPSMTICSRRHYLVEQFNILQFRFPA